MQADPRALIAGSVARLLSGYQPREAVRGALYVARKAKQAAGKVASKASQRAKSVLKIGSK
jgi:hypothetical protein